MASNGMYACPNCKTGNKSGGNCLSCGTPMMFFGKKLTLPKKNNKRAWKRIANGEVLWDRRKVRNRYRPHRVPDTYITCEKRKVLVNYGRYSVRVSKIIPGTDREVTNYRKLPEIDLGG